VISSVKNLNENQKSHKCDTCALRFNEKKGFGFSSENAHRESIKTLQMSKILTRNKFLKKSDFSRNFTELKIIFDNILYKNMFIVY